MTAGILFLSKPSKHRFYPLTERGYKARGGKDLLMSYISNNIMRWGLAIIAAIILGIGLVYICGLIFSNSDTSPKAPSSKAVEYSTKTFTADTNEHSLSYQKTLEKHENAKQFLDKNIILPPQTLIVSDPHITPPKFTTTNPPKKPDLSLDNIEIDECLTPLCTREHSWHGRKSLPIMPPEAQKSGHCKLRFDIDRDGKPYNIQPLNCTQDIFEQPSITTVAKWYYPPKIQDGIAVERRDVESKIQYKLLDERGNLIPE